MLWISLVNFFTDGQPHVKENEDAAEHVRSVESSDRKITSEIRAVPRTKGIDSLYVFLLDLSNFVSDRQRNEVRPIHRGIVWFGVNGIQSDLVLLGVGIGQRFAILQMPGDLDARFKSLFFATMVTQILLIFFPRLGFQENTVVRKLLRPLKIEFNEKEDNTARDGGEHVPPVDIIAAHFERGPRQHDRYRRHDQDRGVHRADWNVEKSVRPFPRVSIETQEDVSGKESAEEHYFGGEKQPDANLRIPQTGVRPSGDCVRNFHWLMHQRWFGRAPRTLGRFDRLVLHRVILVSSGQTVFVRPAISDWSDHEISVRRRRRRGPFQRGRLPRIVVHFFTVLDAPKEIDDERNLGETHDPR